MLVSRSELVTSSVHNAAFTLHVIRHRSWYVTRANLAVVKVLVHALLFDARPSLHCSMRATVIPPSHLFRMSRNQAEPARMEEFSKFAAHSRGNFNLTKNSHRFVRMPFEYLECVSNLPRMILAHSGYISSRMQFECTWNTVGIEDELGTFWHDLK